MLVRASIIVALALLAVWLLPNGGQATFAGLALMLLAVCGCFVKPRRVAWYVLSVALVMGALFLGVKDGPFDVATTGYCGSVFEPGHVVMDDAPPGTYERCAEVRRERIPLVAGLGLLGVVAVVTSVRTTERNLREPEHVPPRRAP